MAEELSPAGGRPGRSRPGARSREAAAAASRGFFRDAVRHLRRRARPGRGDERAAYDQRLGRLERGALADLDLDATADAATIRVRYIELVKRCHPDANGGDRSAEHKLQRVIKAYKTLRKAKLV